MAHHKRKRPKSRRAGCLLCKPWKANHSRKTGPMGRDRISVQRRWQGAAACE